MCGVAGFFAPAGFVIGSGTRGVVRIPKSVDASRGSIANCGYS